jgi:hypothetical protein
MDELRIWDAGGRLICHRQEKSTLYQIPLEKLHPAKFLFVQVSMDGRHVRHKTILP